MIPSAVGVVVMWNFHPTAADLKLSSFDSSHNLSVLAGMLNCAIPPAVVKRSCLDEI